MGENLISFYKHKIKSEWKIAFFAAFFGTLLIHIYKFTNTLPNHDSFYNVYSTQSMIGNGRWFLQYACCISSYFDLPWINGIMCAVWLGLTAALITRLFELRNPVVIVLSALILAATPSTTETLFFEYTADGYFLGLMLAALAAVCSCCVSRKWGSVVSALCICVCVAIYQSCVSFAIILCIFYLVNALLSGTMSLQQAWKWIGRQILIYAGAMVAYYGIWKIILALSGAVITGYQGISSIGQDGIGTVLSGAVKSVQNILLYFLEWNILKHPMNTYAFLNLVFLICFFAVFIVALVKSGTIRSGGKVATILLCVVATVPVISLWSFLSSTVIYRAMMMHGVCIYYIFAIILFDRWVQPRISTVFGILMAAVIFNMALMANIAYFYLDKSYEKTYYMGMQMMEQIEEKREENENIEAIAFLGYRGSDVFDNNWEHITSIKLFSGYIEEDLMYDHAHSYRVLKYTFGLNLPEASVETIDALEAGSTFENMENWPSEDSVQIVDNILVIKLEDELCPWKKN